MALTRPIGPITLLLQQLVAVWDYLDAFMSGGDVAWTSYTPAFTGLTVGNGTIVAKWMRVGRMVHVRFHLTLGSTSSVAGAVTVALPITAVAYPGTAGTTPFGLARHFDGANAFEGVIIYSSTSVARIGVYDASATHLKAVDLSSTIPFTWGTGDELAGQFCYEAA